MRSRTATSMVIVVGVLGLMTGACSSGSKSVSTTVATQPNPEVDRARVLSLLVTAADLPAGWVGSKHTRTADDRAESQKLAECAGALFPGNDVVDIDGDDFGKGSNEVSSTVTSVDSRADFLADSRAIKSDKLLNCTRSVLAQDLPRLLAQGQPGVTVQDLTVTRLPSATYGEVTVAYRVGVTVSGARGSIRVLIDEFALGSGRDELTVTFTGQGAPFDAALEKAVVAKVGSRIARSTV